MARRWEGIYRSIEEILRFSRSLEHRARTAAHLRAQIELLDPARIATHMRRLLQVRVSPRCAVDNTANSEKEMVNCAQVKADRW